MTAEKKQSWLLRSWCAPVLATLLSVFTVYKFYPGQFTGPARACLCQIVIQNTPNEKEAEDIILSAKYQDRTFFNLLGPSKSWCQIKQVIMADSIFSKMGTKKAVYEYYKPWFGEASCYPSPAIRDAAIAVSVTFAAAVVMQIAARRLFSK